MILIKPLLLLVAASAAILTTAATADAAPRPVFRSVTPTFQAPNLTIGFQERGLAKNHQVRYELHGNRHTVWECADGSNSIEIGGPILDNASGYPFGSTPVTKTYPSDKRGEVAGSLTAEPHRAVQFNGSTWGPLTCADGNPPVMTADQYYGTSDEPLFVVDTTNGVRTTLSGVFGFCTSTVYHCR